jgi:hypothetical protein
VKAFSIAVAVTCWAVWIVLLINGVLDPPVAAAVKPEPFRIEAKTDDSLDKLEAAWDTLAQRDPTAAVYIGRLVEGDGTPFNAAAWVNLPEYAAGIVHIDSLFIAISTPCEIAAALRHEATHIAIGLDDTFDPEPLSVDAEQVLAYRTEVAFLHGCI